MLLLVFFGLIGLDSLWLYNGFAFNMSYLVTPFLLTENSSGKASKAKRSKTQQANS